MNAMTSLNQRTLVKVMHHRKSVSVLSRVAPGLVMDTPNRATAQMPRTHKNVTVLLLVVPGTVRDVVSVTETLNANVCTRAVPGTEKSAILVLTTRKAPRKRWSVSVHNRVAPGQEAIAKCLANDCTNRHSEE